MTICSVSAVICALCVQGGSFPTLHAYLAMGDPGGRSELHASQGKSKGREWVLRFGPWIQPGFPTKERQTASYWSTRPPPHVQNNSAIKRALCSNQVSFFPEEINPTGHTALFDDLVSGTKPRACLWWEVVGEQKSSFHPNMVRKTKRHHSHNSFTCSDFS